MVDRLGTLTRAIATLRSSLGKSGGAAAARALTGGTPQPRQEKSGTQAAQSQITMLASRLGALRHDDPMRARKALRLFIEAVLLDEFGSDLILSAEFEHLVDRSLLAIESDESLRETLLEATRELLPKA
jgi:hypothetical protein